MRIRPSRGGRPALELLLATLLTSVAAACSTLPGASQGFRIDSVTTRGPYLDARMSRGGETVRFFFPADDEECRRMLRPENIVDYVALGPLGVLRADDERCQPVGIGSLDWWRRQRGRPEVPPLPRGTARFQPVYRDAEVTLVRGRFPLTGLVNWAGGYDTIAVLPRDSACQPLVERGEATIEYRASGPVPLRLLSDAQSCVIEGLVQPLKG